MSSTIKARLLALALCCAAIAIAIGATSSRSDAQFTAAPQNLAKWWPPHPRDQVQWIAENFTMQGDAEVQLAVVPIDRWLVIVPQGDQGNVGMGGSSGSLRLYQDAGGVLELRAKQASSSLWKGPMASTSLGWTFAPGTRAIIKNISSNATNAEYSLFGYYVDA